MGINFLALEQVKGFVETLDRRVETKRQLDYNDVHLSFKERKKANEVLLANEKAHTCQGDVVLATIRRYIRLKLLSKQQLLFTELYNQALFPFIYEDEFDANELRIMTENFIKKLHQIALICCPRRFGKTFVTAWYAACAIAAIPKIRVTIFSPSKRQSIQIMTHVRRMFDELVVLSQLRYKLIKGKNNQECFAIEIGGTERIIKGLPAKENTVRGVDADLAILDEGAATPQTFATKVVFPVSIPGRTALVILSTIQAGTEAGEDNWFTTMLSLIDETGTPISAVYKFVLACDKCIEQGKEDSCKCKLNELPHWHNKSKHKMLGHIYHALGEDDAMAQENKGIINKSSKAVFSDASVRYLFNSVKNPPFDHGALKEPPPFIMTYVDPASGGGKSEMAIMSFFKYQGQYIIVGTDSIKVELTKLYTDQIIVHLKKLRTLPQLENVIIALAIENNQGLPVNDIATAVVKEVPDLILINKDFFEESVSNSQLYQGKRSRDGTVIAGGVVTRGEIKLEAARLLREKLNDNCIKFSKRCFVSHRPTEDSSNEVLLAKLKEKLKLQLKNMNILSKPRKSDDHAAFDEFIFTISSKHKGADDLVMALKLGIRLYDKFVSSERYHAGALQDLVYKHF
jgi:hypothetical protein